MKIFILFGRLYNYFVWLIVSQELIAVSVSVNVCMSVCVHMRERMYASALSVCFANKLALYANYPLL